MKPRISVVIPTYNYGHYLPAAVESVRAQGWPDLEIIVVDDGSTDDTPRVMKELAGDDLRYIRQENAGPAAARNRGIRESSGEWIAFLDADDLWMPEKLAVQMDELQKHPDASFSYTDTRVRFPDGTERDVKCEPAGNNLLLKLLTGNQFSTPTVVVRRQCFLKVGQFEAELRTGEDWDMWLRLAAHFEGVYVARPLALVRREFNPAKYPLPVLEQCTMRVMKRLFACTYIRQHRPEVLSKKRRAYAWQYSVLAKSYLKSRCIGAFCRLAFKSVAAHPAALGYLIGRRAQLSDG
ncbi:MAG TPA: glycosyltransferase [Pyrinomonadaceae bacterium]